MGVPFETFLKRRGGLLMGRRSYVPLRRRYDVPIRRRGNVPLRRLGDVSLRIRSVFYLGRTCNVAGTYRETSLRRRYDVLMPDGVKAIYCLVFSPKQVNSFLNYSANSFMIK